MNCRFCGAHASLPFIDLVNAPPSNSYLTSDQLNEPEVFYPLKVFVCENCWLVQIDEYRKCSDIFNAKYAYFSSFSTSWLDHARHYVETMAKRLDLTSQSLAVEVASNDGYLLQYVRSKNIPCLGIEPTASTAAAARDKGVETLEEFFGVDCASRLIAERGQADLMLGNNVLAHVPDINDFVEGFKIALKPTGTVTFEFPHVLNLIRFCQFDTIYHEHFCYLSLGTVRRILAAHGLTVYDVEQLQTHGGSLRVFARHTGCNALAIRPSVSALEQTEIAAGLNGTEGYQGFQQAAETIRASFLAFLCDCRTKGKRVAGYGAAAKGNTFLNYCGVKGTGMIAYVADASPHKQTLFLPGSHIPVVHERSLQQTKPDYVVIFPWNLREEICRQLQYVRQWNAHFVTCVPKLEIW